ncbi:MAG TPA: P1 family peptidase [Gemmatimonadales bacterium]
MNRRHLLMLALIFLSATPPLRLSAQARARTLGIPFDGTPGPLNAITDLAGVEVGHATIIRGDGRLVVGQGPVRTGVTAVFPRGKQSAHDVMAAWFTLNGNGEMTGTAWVEESGFLGGPVMITNTHSVGTVHQATIEYVVRQGKAFSWSLPVVAETWDGPLNDINGFHVKPDHIREAIENARGGPVPEGSVGGGTGMVCNGFKGGIGTSSRVMDVGGTPYIVGVLVQCNYGRRSQFKVAGIPWALADAPMRPGACYEIEPSAGAERFPRCDTGRDGEDPEERGSIIIVVGTDAPLLPHQLKRVARRAALGIGRLGGIGGNSSGDIFIAFSTANRGGNPDTGAVQVTMLANDAINPLFDATIQATEEAILNAMVAARDMVGADGLRMPALPHDKVRALLAKHGRLVN